MVPSNLYVVIPESQLLTCSRIVAGSLQQQQQHAQQKEQQQRDAQVQQEQQQQQQQQEATNPAITAQPAAKRPHPDTQAGGPSYLSLPSWHVILQGISAQESCIFA